MCDFSQTFYVMDVCDVMYAYGSGLGFWGVRFCGWYCPNVIVFLACWGTWRCELTLFCVEIVKRHLQIFIHSFTALLFWLTMVFTHPFNLDFCLDCYRSLKTFQVEWFDIFIINWTLCSLWKVHAVLGAAEGTTCAKHGCLFGVVRRTVQALPFTAHLSKKR